MANVLDLRRRIRSVKNTRQITKAMKMVSAARLRRAQERAMLARPYARMLTNVLESLVRRTDIYGCDSADIVHPLLAAPKTWSWQVKSTHQEEAAKLTANASNETRE